MNNIWYALIYFVLLIIILSLLTFDLYQYHRAYDCIYSQDIQCFVDFYCSVPCSYNRSGVCEAKGKRVNECFCSDEDVGLTSCLTGIQSQQASYCTAPLSNDQQPSCECIPQMETTKNCLNSCVSYDFSEPQERRKYCKTSE